MPLTMSENEDDEALLSSSDEAPEPNEWSGLKARVSKAVLGIVVLAGCFTILHRHTWNRAPYRQGSQLWTPSGWHKDAEGNDVKDTWDHYQMPNCDSGPPKGARKKVIVGSHEKLRKMKDKLKLHDSVHIHPIRKMKDVLDLTDPQPQLFATDGDAFDRRLRGATATDTETDSAHDSGAAAAARAAAELEEEDLKDGKVHVKWVYLKKTRAQQICADHVAIASSDHARMIQKHQQFEEHRKAILGLHYWQGTHRCGTQFYNTDFPSRVEWRDARGVESPAHCQRACTWNADCEGFSWSKWGCFLKKTPKLPKDAKSANKGSNHTQHFIHEFKAGVYSGYPCDRKESPYPWINDELQKHTLPKPKAYRAANASMFCTMLILPYSYEVDLAIMQQKYYYSIFMCEHWKIYSSQRLQLAPQLATHLINTSQVAEAAGQWGTALNTEAFLAYWRAMILDGDYLKARWLVKVDPDTVWFPDRLQPVLLEMEEKHSLEAPGVYLNNCPFGLHGPIEILSQTAFSTLATVSAKCYWGMNNWGNWQWGEDMWLDQCFLTVGHVKRVYVPKMLAEDHCNKWPGWNTCQAKDMIAFHPFKNEQQYIDCAATGISTTTTRTVTRTTTATVTTFTQTTTHIETPVEQIGSFFGHIFHH